MKLDNGLPFAFGAVVAVATAGMIKRGSAARHDHAWYFQHGKMDPVRREQANQVMIEAGLDGNGRFHRVGEAINLMWASLEPQGMEIVDVPSAHLFMGQSGTRQLRVGWKDELDPFMEHRIEDSVLHISWYKLDSGRYEVIAYLS